MRTRGHGTIERNRGRFRVRLSLPDGSRPAYVVPDDVDPETFRAALVERLIGTVDDPMLGGLTLGVWGATWLDARELTHRDADGDRQRWGAYIAGTELSRVKLEALAPSAVLKWARSLVARPARRGGTITRGTAMNAWGTLRACLRAAMAEEKASADRIGPILALDLPASPIAATVELDERIEWLRVDEIARVLALRMTAEQRSAIVVGMHTMLRAGELHGLAWERLDWSERSIVVSRSRNAATKAGRVARVPLLAPAHDELRERWESAGKPSRGLVWPADGGGCHARGYDWGWSDHPSSRFVKFGLRRLAGIRRSVTWHDATRHTGAVHLLRGTWAPELVPRAYRMEEVSRFLRHSSVAVTERHYAALTFDALPVTPFASPAADRDASRAAHRDASSEYSVDGSAPAPHDVSARSSCDASSSSTGDASAAAEQLSPLLTPTVTRGGIGGIAAIYSEPVSEGDSESRPRELNSGPTVYEGGAATNDHAVLAGASDTGNSPSDTAREVLRRVAEGLPPGEVGDELVAVVLGSRAVRLAIEAQAGGAFAIRRLVELAGLFAEATPASRTDVVRRRG